MSKEFYSDIPTRAFHSYSKRKIAEKKGVKEAVEVSKLEDGYFLHLQSEHSLRRASMTLREMFQRAKDLSALTDSAAACTSGSASCSTRRDAPPAKNAASHAA